MTQDRPPAPEPRRKPSGNRMTLIVQYLLPISFSVAMLVIIGWILSLLRLSRKLHDETSASIGISIVAIPLFLLLLGVFWYVFLGIIRNQGGPEVRADETGPRTEEGVEE